MIRLVNGAPDRPGAPFTRSMRGMTTGSHILQVRGLTVERPGESGVVLVLDGLDLDLSPSTLTDVVGESGAGKTTLLLALARLLPGVTGRLTLDGNAANTIEPRQWRARVTYLPQRSTIFAGSVKDNLTFPWRLAVRSGLHQPSDAHLRAALDSVRLHEIGLDRDALRLSEGQGARIALLRTVLTRPEVLLLDEPDASLDNESAVQVGILTRRFVDEGGAVVRVRHLRSDSHAHRRLTLASGRLVEVPA